MVSKPTMQILTSGLHWLSWAGLWVCKTVNMCKSVEDKLRKDSVLTLRWYYPWGISKMDLSLLWCGISWDFCKARLVLVVVVQIRNLYLEVLLQEETSITAEFQESTQQYNNFTARLFMFWRGMNIIHQQEHPSSPPTTGSIQWVMSKARYMFHFKLRKLCFNDTCLHGSKHLGAVKHEDKVFKVPDCWLPGNVLCLILKEAGWIQSQSHVDKFGSEDNKDWI